MRNFDPNNYPPLIGRWIMCKGSELPPLQWTQRANRLGAQQLCKLKPAQLLEDSKLTDVQTGSCILAGMMLWNGLVNVAEALCQQLEGTEARYWQAMAVRHRARPAEAKQLCQQVKQHPIHAPLAAESLEIIGLGTESTLGRFGQILKQQGDWEPHAFVDLYESARLKETPAATEKVVRELQRLEFFLLLDHCITPANGKPDAAPEPQDPRRAAPTTTS